MNDKKHLLIGVNDVDEQVRQQQEMHRAEEEAVIFSRMKALSGGMIAFYTVDLETDDYYLYNASEDFFALGTATLGSDFFGVAIEDVVNIGDLVRVKVLEVDRMGKISLSLKDAEKTLVPVLISTIEEK